MSAPLDRDRWRRVEAILDFALDLDSARVRDFVDAATASDASLRADVYALLAADEASGSFLRVPVSESAAPLVASLARDLDATTGHERESVGPYRLVRCLGEGGMGVVYLAERVDGHFEQRVAIKVMTQGLRGDAARARFVRERQILARLQHPAIARVFDGGVTSSGAPFFVMEFVDGRPITEFCDARALDTEDRLRLFVQVCGAVAYAHRNLIVHRDLKPSNILVDESGSAKLLDFGIAKLLGERLAADPAQTAFRAMTPDYAAPEQVRGEPITTSTDVYALGVLLFELLTGERPHNLGGAGGDVEHAILAHDPPPPSARVDALRRGRLRGDLDRIVLKALRKAPDERYASAEALADDVRRHLEGQPIAAHPDAIAYRARKFVRRHRAGVAAAALVFGAIVAGLVGTIWQARRAGREARKAEAVTAFLQSLFAASDPAQAKGREPSLRELLDAGARRLETDLAAQPDVQSDVARVIANVYQGLGDYDGVQRLMTAEIARRRRADGPRSLAVAVALTRLGDAAYEQSRYDAANRCYEEALAIVREKRGETTPEAAELLWDLAGVARNRADLAGAERLQRRSLDIYAQVVGPESIEAGNVRESLAIVYNEMGRFDEAAALLEPVVRSRERRLGADDPATLTARYNLAFTDQERGRVAAAATAAADVASRQRRVIGARHDRVALTLRLVARSLEALGRRDEAIAAIDEAIAIHRERFGNDHLHVGIDRIWKASFESRAGRASDAVADARQGLTILDAAANAPRPYYAFLRTTAASALAAAGRADDARPQLQRAESELAAAHHDGVYRTALANALRDIAARETKP